MYSTRSKYCIDFLIDLEGGYNASDPSLHGISMPWFQSNIIADPLIPQDIKDWIGKPGSFMRDDDDEEIQAPDIRGLSKEDCFFLYHWKFWSKYHLDLFPKPLDLIMLVCLVHRETKAREIFQKCISAEVGPINLKTIGSLHHCVVNFQGETVQQIVDVVANLFLCGMKKYYEETYPEGHPKHGNVPGYLARVEKLRKEAGL